MSRQGSSPTGHTAVEKFFQSINWTDSEYQNKSNQNKPMQQKHNNVQQFTKPTHGSHLTASASMHIHTDDNWHWIGVAYISTILNGSPHTQM